MHPLQVTPRVQEKILERLEEAKRLPVTLWETGPDVLSGQVTVGRSHYFNVKLFAESWFCQCRCQKALERGFPCDHGLALMAQLESLPELFQAKWDVFNGNWTSSIFNSNTWRLQYDVVAFVPEGDLASLEPEDLDPWERPPKTGGRPKGKRLQRPATKEKDAEEAAPPAKKRKYTCTGCGQVGHNQKTCESPVLSKMRAGAERQTLKFMKRP